MKWFLNYIVVPIMLAVEVVGVSELYPICKDSIWKTLLLYCGVYFTYDVYRIIKNSYFNY